MANSQDDENVSNLRKPLEESRQRADEARARIRKAHGAKEPRQDAQTHASAQDRDQIEIFWQFSRATGAPQIDPNTIQLRQPPEPDIFCVVASQPRYFELQAITSAVLAKAEKEGPGVIPVGAYSNEKPFKAAIIKKVSKTYNTQGVPVDLVLHYVEHPAPSDDVRDMLLQRYSGEIERLVTSASFLRVWLFSAYAKTAWLIAQRN